MRARVRLACIATIALVLGCLASVSVAAGASASTLPSTVTEHTYATPGGGTVVAFWNTQRLAQTSDNSVPWIVFVHGGAWAFGTPDESDVVDFCGHQAALGIDCFSLGYRLVPGTVWPAQQSDVESELAWVRSVGPTFQLDQRQGLAFGFSAGALMGSIAGLEDGVVTTTNSDGTQTRTPRDATSRLAGVATFDGATDVPDIIHADYDPTISADASELVGGAPYDSAYAQTASVLSHITADQPRVPFLIIHDSGDPYVDVAQSRRLTDGLQTQGFPVTFDLLDGGTHTTDDDPTALRDADAWIQGRLSDVRATEPPSTSTWLPPSNTTLTMPATSVAGHTVTATATITGYNGVTNGTVELISPAGYTIASAAITAGKANLPFTPTAAGTYYPLTARYLGSTTYAASTSNPTTLTVTPKPTPRVYLSLSPTTPKPRGRVVATITVTGTTGTPTGTIHLVSSSGHTLRTATLVSGRLALAIAAGTTGKVRITAEYLGSTTYNAANSTPVTVTVKR